MSNSDKPQTLRTGHFSGPIEFAQLIRDALACAALEGWSEMVWCDPDYDDWPLRESAVIDSLNAWAHAGRKLVMLAHNFDSIRRYQPRFVDWRVKWGHLIECRVCRHIGASEVPSGLWSPGWFLSRNDVVRSIGVSSYEPGRRVQLREVLEECRRQSAPGFPATTLGL